MEKDTQKFESIDKAIYKLPEISKRLRPILWAWICVAVGVGGFFLNRAFPEVSAGLSSLFTALLVVGGFGLLTIIFYYLIGDSRAPYYKPSHKLLTREYYFYAKNEREELMKSFENKDINAMEAVKRSASPDYTLVRYSDVQETIFFVQLFETNGKIDTPISEIVKIEK